MTDGGLERGLATLAALADPTRRALYLYVVRAPDEVGRDEAASAVKISRSLAAFHLDRLVEDGLLEAGYRRLSGRSGPGAGRPAKVYRKKAVIDVQVPERDYLLAAELVMARGGTPSGERQAEAAAHQRGVALGSEARVRMRGRRSRRGLTEALLRLLRGKGFVPASDEGGTVALRNCPFDALAERNPEVICRLNRSFLQGVVDGLGIRHLQPVPVPRQGGCCVTLLPA